MLWFMAKDKKQKPGPKEDHLKIDGDWEASVKQALGKEKPVDGWPEPEEGKGKAKDD